MIYGVFMVADRLSWRKRSLALLGSHHLGICKFFSRYQCGYDVVSLNVF